MQIVGTSTGIRKHELSMDSEHWMEQQIRHSCPLNLLGEVADLRLQEAPGVSEQLRNILQAAGRPSPLM